MPDLSRHGSSAHNAHGFAQAIPHQCGRVFDGLALNHARVGIVDKGQHARNAEHLRAALARPCVDTGKLAMIAHIRLHGVVYVRPVRLRVGCQGQVARFQLVACALTQ